MPPRNIIGHDPGGPHPGERVTHEKVRDVLRARVSNGVGLTQLTYKPFIARAEELGGAHLPKYQLRVGFKVVADLVRQHGLVTGLARYNGAGHAADAYSASVRARQDRWHPYLEGK